MILKSDELSFYLQRLASINHELKVAIADELWSRLPELIESRGSVIANIIDSVDCFSDEQVDEVKQIFNALVDADDVLLKDLYKQQEEDREMLLKLTASSKASKAYVQNKHNV